MRLVRKLMDKLTNGQLVRSVVRGEHHDASRVRGEKDKKHCMDAPGVIHKFVQFTCELSEYKLIFGDLWSAYGLRTLLLFRVQRHVAMLLSSTERSGGYCLKLHSGCSYIVYFCCKCILIIVYFNYYF